MGVTFILNLTSFYFFSTVTGMSFLAIASIVAAIGFVLMMANGCTGGKIGHKTIWGVMLFSFCCCIIGTVCGAVGFMNLYGFNASTWINADFYVGRPGFALAIFGCIMSGLHVIALTATTFFSRPAPAAPKAPEPAADAPAAVMNGVKPQFSWITGVCEYSNCIFL